MWKVMKRGPKPIRDILAELMAKRGYARVQSSEAMSTAWSEAVGQLAAKYSRAGSIRRGTLEVIVANSTFMQELTFQKPSLLKALAKLLPDEKIKDIRFRVGDIQ